jgi:hypothetical protein
VPLTGGLSAAGQPVGAQQVTMFIPPNGSRVVPTLDTLSHFDSYQPLPAVVALAQFKPVGGFLVRQLIATDQLKAKDYNRYVNTHEFSGSRTNTLPARVFHRSAFHPGKQIKFTHKVPVIPVSRQRDVKPG